MTPFDDDIHTMVNLGHGFDASPVDLAHYLVAIGGTATGRYIEVGDVPVTIGRDARQALVFADDNEVSRLHARISLVDRTVIAEDLGSTNGTFVDGARLSGPRMLSEGNVVRVGKQLLKYERRSRGEVERARELDSGLRKASGYVMSLLPAPIADGPIRTDWHFAPSAQLGGDGFGYYWLDADTFVCYLVDVSGHGVGPAMHSASVLNVLRQRALPDVDFRDPGKVLENLNARFQMSEHGGLFFTIWYGVYKASDRTLAYSSAGHHPAFLLESGKAGLRSLGAPALMIGVTPEVTYDVQKAAISPGGALYLFSDGVFEIVATDQRRWTLADFLPLITEPAEGKAASESSRLYQAVTQAAGSAQLEDDFSLVVFRF